MPADSPYRLAIVSQLNKLGGFGSYLTVTPECEIVLISSQPSSDFVLETSGFIAAKSKLHLNPSVHGKILELPIREGQPIRKGDVVVRIDDAQYKADVEQAEAGLELAEARLRELKEGSRKEDISQAKAVVSQAQSRFTLMDAELKRAELLRDSISTAEYDKTKSARDEAQAYLEQMRQSLALAEAGARPAQIEVAQAEVDRSRAALTKARHWLDSAIVHSPISGIVLQKTGEIGEYVRPESLVQSLCVVADLNEVEAEVDVQERDLSLVHVGQPCKISAEAHGDVEFQGRIARILPIASRQRGAVQLRVSIVDANSRLLPDMNCRVMILKEPSSAPTETKSYRLPLLAVTKEGEKAFVFVLRNAAAQKVSVELGSVADGMIEIKDGVQEGDRVLLARNGKLHDGQTVNVPELSLN